MKRNSEGGGVLTALLGTARSLQKLTKNLSRQGSRSNSRNASLDGANASDAAALLIAIAEEEEAPARLRTAESFRERRTRASHSKSFSAAQMALALVNERESAGAAGPVARAPQPLPTPPVPSRRAPAPPPRAAQPALEMATMTMKKKKTTRREKPASAAASPPKLSPKDDTTMSKKKKKPRPASLVGAPPPPSFQLPKLGDSPKDTAPTDTSPKAKDKRMSPYTTALFHLLCNHAARSQPARTPLLSVLPFGHLRLGTPGHSFQPKLAVRESFVAFTSFVISRRAHPPRFFPSSLSTISGTAGKVWSSQSHLR